MKLSATFAATFLALIFTSASRPLPHYPPTSLSSRGLGSVSGPRFGEAGKAVSMSAASGGYSTTVKNAPKSGLEGIVGSKVVDHFDANSSSSDGSSSQVTQAHANDTVSVRGIESVLDDLFGDTALGDLIEGIEGSGDDASNSTASPTSTSNPIFASLRDPSNKTPV